MLTTLQASSAAGQALLGLVGATVQDVTAKIGLGCSPISAIGVGSGNACQAQPVCCQNNNVVSAIDPWCERSGNSRGDRHRVASSPLAVLPSRFRLHASCGHHSVVPVAFGYSTLA